MPVSKKRKKEGKPVQRQGPTTSHEGGADHPEAKPGPSPIKAGGKPRNPFVAQQRPTRGAQRGR